jgi:uncharacterized protein (TIGR00725 family)
MLKKRGSARHIHISVVGTGEADRTLLDLARAVGREVARADGVLICGGLGGVMAGACRGAREAGGRTIAIVPGPDPSTANPWAEVVIATGLGHARNVLVVQSGDAVIALPGSFGTLSEVALALKVGRPVVGLGAWGDIEGVVAVESPEEAVRQAFRLAAAQQ